jgi:hypothetical protein
VQRCLTQWGVGFHYSYKRRRRPAPRPPAGRRPPPSQMLSCASAFPALLLRCVVCVAVVPGVTPAPRAAGVVAPPPQPPLTADQAERARAPVFLFVDPGVVAEPRPAGVVAVPGPVEKDPRNPLLVEDKIWDVRWDNTYITARYDRQLNKTRMWWNSQLSCNGDGTTKISPHDECGHPSWHSNKAFDGYWPWQSNPNPHGRAAQQPPPPPPQQQPVACKSWQLVNSSNGSPLSDCAAYRRGAHPPHRVCSGPRKCSGRCDHSPAHGVSLGACQQACTAAGDGCVVIQWEALQSTNYSVGQCWLLGECTQQQPYTSNFSKQVCLEVQRCAEHHGRP